MKTSGAHPTAAVEDIAHREGEEARGPRLRADYGAFPSRACIFQIDNVAGLGDQPGDFHVERCFPSEINDCYYSISFFFFLLGAHGEQTNGRNQANRMGYII